MLNRLLILLILIILPFFGSSQFKDSTIIDVTPIDNEEIFILVETMPEFNGGQEGLFNYLQNNLVYPKKAKENGIEGTVVVNFVVGTDGQTRNVKILNSVNQLLDAEAVRVVRVMPKWTPGYQKGEKVSVSYNLPIKFSLSKNNSTTISRGDYVDQLTFIDTIINTIYYNNGNIKKIELMDNILKSNGNGIPNYYPFIKVIKYRKNGMLRREKSYDKGIILHELSYDRKGRKSVEYIYKYEKPDEILLHQKANGNITGDNLMEYYFIIYIDGKIASRQRYMNGKRDGVTEVYSLNTGDLKKVKVYKNGKKISKKVIKISAE